MRICSFGCIEREFGIVFFKAEIFLEMLIVQLKETLLRSKRLDELGEIIGKFITETRLVMRDSLI